MSVQGDLLTVLANIANGRVFPEFAPQDVASPFVVIRRTLHEPLMALMGYAGITKSVFVFECYADNKATALTVASEVIDAIDASALIRDKFREPVSGEDFEPETMSMMEPVQYSIWHA